MVDFNESETYCINPSVRLRNDKKYVVVGFPEGDSVMTLRLAPIEGIVVSLLNGKRTCAEVEDICMAMTDAAAPDPNGDARNAVKLVIQKHLKPAQDMPHPLVVPTSGLSPEQLASLPQYDPVAFIVAPHRYKPHDFKLAFPAGMLWLLTNDCQTSCLYCYMDKKAVSRTQMLSWERIEELMAEAHGKGLMGLSISGGDPLCYPHICEFLELMDEYSLPPTSFATKACVSPEFARRLARCKALKELQFSIDSTVPEVADFLVQSPGFYARTMESIRNAMDAGITSINIKSVITPYNLPTIPKLYRDMKALGVTRIRLATYVKSGYNHKNKLFNHADDYKWLDDEIAKLNAEFPGDDIHYQNGAPTPEPISRERREKNWAERSLCTAGRDTMTVAPNGKAVACEQMPLREEDYLGDLHVQSIEEVWNGKLMDEYLFHPPRHKFAETPCYDCGEFEECQTLRGICVRDCCIHYGTRWYPSPNCPKVPENRMVRIL